MSISTQKIALNALAFLYIRMLEKPLENLGELNRTSAQSKLPIVLPRREMMKLLHNMEGVSRLVASLLYGSGLRRNEAVGLRRNEAVGLRVKDVDFD